MKFLCYMYCLINYLFNVTTYYITNYQFVKDFLLA